jgi:hypothetical protein
MAVQTGFHTMHDLTQLSTQQLAQAVNASQFDRHSSRGFYESYFLRANHPSLPLAFWIRYTLFSPRGNPAATEGQLWAIYFDGETSHITAIKQPVPLARCAFSGAGLQVRLGDAVLDESMLRGKAGQQQRELSWDLRYDGARQPAFLLPLSLYHRSLPKAKALSGVPLADFFGTLHVNGQRIDVDGWRGSQNHNWGLKHTDRYAWGQVAGFDGEPQAFLECSTARLKFGPLWTPPLSSVVLRLGERELRLNSIGQALRNRGRYGWFHWSLEGEQGPVHLAVQMQAPAERFVALGYDDPPGGQKTCLNTKLAACTLHLSERGCPTQTLTTQHRAAFEILTDRQDHGIPLSA